MASITKGFKKGYKGVKDATYGGGIYATATNLHHKATENIGGPIYRGGTGAAGATSKGVTKGYRAAGKQVGKAKAQLGQRGFDITAGKAFAGTAPPSTENIIILREQAKAQAAARDYAAAGRTVGEIYDMIDRAPEHDYLHGGREDAATWAAHYYNVAGDKTNAKKWHDLREKNRIRINIPDVDKTGKIVGTDKPEAYAVEKLKAGEKKSHMTPSTSHWGYVVYPKSGSDQWTGRMSNTTPPIDDPGPPPGWKYSWPATWAGG